MIKAHTTPRQWEVPGAVLDMDRVLVGPLRIQTASTATLNACRTHLVEASFLRLFSDLQDIARALFPVTWSSSVCHCSFVLFTQRKKTKTKNTNLQVILLGSATVIE